MEYVTQASIFLVNLYHTIYNAQSGWLVAMIVGFILSSIGTKISGSGPTGSGMMIGGVVHITNINPGVEGTAKTFIGRLCGSLISLSGVILMLEGMLAGVNHFMYG